MSKKCEQPKVVSAMSSGQKESNTRTRNVVIGAGALGLFLNYDLQEEGEQCLVLSRSIPPLPIGLLAENSTTAKIISPVITTDLHHLIDCLLAPQQTTTLIDASATLLRIFVCLPPGEVLGWTKEVVEHLTADESNFGVPKLELVMLNNGFIQSEVWKLWRRAVPTATLVRGLVFAGFEKISAPPANNETQPCGTLIKHNGGHLIRFGVVESASKGKSANFAPPPARLFKWQHDPDISATEFAKFFVNLALAAAVGAQVFPNRTIYTLWPNNKLEEFAKNYALLSTRSHSNPRALLKVLQETVGATAANVNSISLARSRGNSKPWLALVSQLTELIHSTDNSQVRDYFLRFLRECDAEPTTEI